jgi:hypothetical protein
MAIKRNKYQGTVALGSRVKTTIVAGLDSFVEGAELIADVIITARSAVELVHGSLQPAIAEQKLEYMKIVQAGAKELEAGGMTAEEAKEYLLG